MTTNLKSLIGLLNPTCRSALEAAAGLCLARDHYEVDLEHLLIKLLEPTNTDVSKILGHYEINHSHLERDLTKALDHVKIGNTRSQRVPVLSAYLLRLIEQAWLTASIDFAVTRIRSGHLILALISNPELSRLIRESTHEFAKISVEELKKTFYDLTGNSVEGNTERLELDSREIDRTSPEAPIQKLGKTPSLDQFTINLTQRAKVGKIDPVLGREGEIRQIIDILTRRRQNNPILTGEAGVGKTAVVEGFALRIAAGDVPTPLRTAQLHSLDLGLLQAGAGVKGEFENRLKSLIEEVKCSPHPIILFIDEAHTLIGAGGQAGQGDAANLLKPALARGEFRTVAATTWIEYKKYFEQDPALARRFQVVKVEEPSEEKAIEMLRGNVEVMERHHKVRITDDALVSAVHLSSRYLVGRQLPDKAIGVLDTACARVAIGQSATPAVIEDLQRQLERIKVERHILKRESAVGAEHEKRLEELDAEELVFESEFTALTSRWQEEKDLTANIHNLHERIEAMMDEPVGKEESAALNAETGKEQLAFLTTQLKAMQGDAPLVQFCVNSQIIGEVVSAWTGVPLGKMLKDEVAVVMALQQMMEERVIGQSHALAEIAKRIRTARANLEDPGKPKGVFLLVGTSGVGKTETALALADILYGGERNIISLNMSEYQQDYSVSNLIGSAKGLVGYGEGGILTEAVRRRPHSIVLLDEIEKAHPRVFELFFQVFDKGLMNDTDGREIDFKNTVIILTSNAGTDTIMQMWLESKGAVTADQLQEALRPELRRIFKPAFLGRLTIIPYYPIGDEILRRIIHLKLEKIKTRILKNHRAELTYDDALVDAVASRCTEVDSGARNVDHILSGTLLPEMSNTLLAAMGNSRQVSKISVTVAQDGAFRYEII